MKFWPTQYLFIAKGKVLQLETLGWQTPKPGKELQWAAAKASLTDQDQHTMWSRAHC